jgi:hypothetical protein
VVVFSRETFYLFAYPQNSSIPDENWLDTFYPGMFDRFNASQVPLCKQGQEA